MKKILLSLITLIGVAAMVTGATRAVFSDQKEIAGNTVATGTLELTLNHSAGKPFSISNAYPGYVSGWEYMDIYNTGSLPFEAEMSLSKTSGSDDLWDYITIEMKTSGWNSDCTDGDGGENTIYSGLAKDFTTGGLAASDITYWHLANEDDGSGPPDNIRTGWSERVCQKTGVDSSAGNDVQGASVVFTETVDAVQDND